MELYVTGADGRSRDDEFIIGLDDRTWIQRMANSSTATGTKTFANRCDFRDRDEWALIGDCPLVMALMSMVLIIGFSHARKSCERLV